MLPAIAGKGLGEVCQTRIFAPLGMDETTFELADALRQRVASMHARNADGSLAPMDFELPPRPKVHMGGHGLQLSHGPDWGASPRAWLTGFSLNGEG